MSRTAVHTIALCSILIGSGCVRADPAVIVLDAAEMRFRVGVDGTLRALRAATGGDDLATPGVPIARIWLDGVAQPASAAGLQDGRLVVSFEGTERTLALSVEPGDGGLRLRSPPLPDGVERLDLLALEPDASGRACCGERIVRFGDAAVYVVGGRPHARIAIDREGRTRVWTASLRHGLGEGGVDLVVGVVAPDRLAETIERVERALEIPLGIAAKRAETARRPYLMVRGLSERNAERIVEIAARGGFGSILLQEGVWADYGDRYRVPARAFPSGKRGLRRVVRAIHERGMLAGAHVYASKLPKKRAAPGGRAERRLFTAKSVTLARPLEIDADRIVTDAPPRDFPRETGTRDLRIGDELLTYTELSLEPPYGFRGVVRGRYGSRALRHPAGAAAHQLITDESRVIFLIDQRTDLLDRHARDIAATYESVGMDWLYFDGAEDVHPPRWYRTTRPKIALLDVLERPPAIVQSAADVGYDWHLTTRRGQRDYFWRFTTYKDEIDDAIARGVPTARDDLMVTDLGWFDVRRPTEHHPGARLDDVEYLASRALASDSAYSVLAHADDLSTLRNLDAMLHTMSRYEQHRALGTFATADGSPPTWLRPRQDVLLVERPGHAPRIVEAQEVAFVAGTSREVRAFIGEPIDGVVPIAIQPELGPVSLQIDLDPDRVAWHDYAGRDLGVVVEPGARLVVPLDSRVFLHVDGRSRGALWAALKRARIREAPPSSR